MPTQAEKTIYALISSMERDLGSHILSALASESSPLVADEETAARKILARDNKTLAPEADWRGLLPYLTLGQKLQILQRNTKMVSEKLQVPKAMVDKLYQELSSLKEIRNTVFHAKPYVEGHLQETIMVAATLVASELRELLPELGEELPLVRKPNYIEKIVIPEFWWNATLIENNLPTAQHDDVGFIGRVSDQENLLMLLRGNYPIISVTGEGGIGKTSLVLHCLRQLVQPGSGFSGQFDLVHWSTLKTTHLTTAGIRQIEDALSNEVQLLSSIVAYSSADASIFGANQSSELPQLFERLKQMLTQRRVLLVIDNLDTIDLKALQPLFEAVPGHSKILLTSRLSLGGFDAPYPLKSMEMDDAVRLMRAVTQPFNGEIDRSEGELRQLCGQLFCSPLMIRWFAQSRAQQKSERQLLDVKGGWAEVLRFCFDTIYASLEDKHRHYLRLLAAVPTPLSVVQLCLLLNEYDAEIVRSDLYFLSKSNLLQSLRDNWATGQGELWSISDAARQFIVSQSNYLHVEERREIVDRYNGLFQKRDAARQVAAQGLFRFRGFNPQSTDEAMLIDILQAALSESGSAKQARKGKDEKKFTLHEMQAHSYLERAMKLMPGYYEVWRVSAYVKDNLGNAGGARADFETALDMCGFRREPTLWHYARFLLNQNNPESAVLLLSEIASNSEAPTELLDVLSDAQSKARRHELALSVLEILYQRGLEIVPHLRIKFLRRHLVCLCEAAFKKEEREKSLQLLGRAFKLALELGQLDRFERTQGEVQKLFQAACQFTAEQPHLTEQWSEFMDDLTLLSTRIPLVGIDIKGTNVLRRACPEFCDREDIQRLFLREQVQETERPGWVTGQLKPVKRENGKYVFYAFIQGSDGEDYYAPQSSFIGLLPWQRICDLSYERPHVEFRVDKAITDALSRQAIKVILLQKTKPKKVKADTSVSPAVSDVVAPLTKSTLVTVGAPNSSSPTPSLDSSVQFGTVKPFGIGRPYTFIAGDNGQDYYLRCTDLQQTTWQELRQMIGARVGFRASPLVPGGKHSGAYEVRVLKQKRAEEN